MISTSTSFLINTVLSASFWKNIINAMNCKNSRTYLICSIKKTTIMKRSLVKSLKLHTILLNCSTNTVLCSKMRIATLRFFNSFIKFTRILDSSLIILTPSFGICNEIKIVKIFPRSWKRLKHSLRNFLLSLRIFRFNLLSGDSHSSRTFFILEELSYHAWIS